MKNSYQGYGVFLKFIQAYSPKSFRNIDPDDPLMLELEAGMVKNNQFFYVADVINLEIIFTSKGSTQMIGVEPKDLSLGHFMEATHPDDLQRLSTGRVKLIKKAQDLFISGEEFTILSSNFRIKNGLGEYSNILTQNYLFYRSVPIKTVYLLKVHTNIDWCTKIKHGYHYYIGNDMSYFRYPDKKMMLEGNIFTKREFEIIKLIEQGLNTEEIAGELFLSIYTVHTHRRNILKKTDKTSISDLIYDLKERGFL